MKVDITPTEAGLIIGLMDNYKKTHPYNFDEIKICDEVFTKLYKSVYDSSGQTKKTWYFTVEHDIPVTAYTEEEAEIIFRNIYGHKPILGIIRPYDTSSTTKNDPVMESQLGVRWMEDDKPK